MKFLMLRLARRAAAAADGLRRVMADRLILETVRAAAMVAVVQTDSVEVAVTTVTGWTMREMVVRIVVVVVVRGGRTVRTKTVFSAGLVTVTCLANSMSVGVDVTTEVDVEARIVSPLLYYGSKT